MRTGTAADSPRIGGRKGDDARRNCYNSAVCRPRPGRIPRPFSRLPSRNAKENCHETQESCFRDRPGGGRRAGAGGRRGRRQDRLPGRLHRPHRKPGSAHLRGRRARRRPCERTGRRARRSEPGHSERRHDLRGRHRRRQCGRPPRQLRERPRHRRRALLGGHDLRSEQRRPPRRGGGGFAGFDLARDHYDGGQGSGFPHHPVRRLPGSGDGAAAAVEGHRQHRDHVRQQRLRQGLRRLPGRRIQERWGHRRGQGGA